MKKHCMRFMQCFLYQKNCDGRMVKRLGERTVPLLAKMLVGVVCYISGSVLFPMEFFANNERNRKDRRYSHETSDYLRDL